MGWEWMEMSKETDRKRKREPVDGMDGLPASRSGLRGGSLDGSGRSACDVGRVHARRRGVRATAPANRKEGLSMAWEVPNEFATRLERQKKHPGRRATSIPRTLRQPPKSGHRRSPDLDVILLTGRRGII